MNTLYQSHSEKEHRTQFYIKSSGWLYYLLEAEFFWTEVYNNQMFWSFVVLYSSDFKFTFVQCFSYFNSVMVYFAPCLCKGVETYSIFNFWKTNSFQAQYSLIFPVQTSLCINDFNHFFIKNNVEFLISFLW